VLTDMQGRLGREQQRKQCRWAHERTSHTKDRPMGKAGTGPKWLVGARGQSNAWQKGRKDWLWHIGNV
jgi:hypothetical protein